MAYDKEIERHIEALIVSWVSIEKKLKFGEICQLKQGNICFGIWQELLIHSH